MLRYVSLAGAALAVASVLYPLPSQARMENDPSALIMPEPATEAAAEHKEASAENETRAKKVAGPKAGNGLDQLIAKRAAEHGVPVALARAVVRVESNFRPGVTGRAGEVGLMQIKPATARGIGYTGSVKALYDPGTNLAWGMKYLAGAYNLAGGDICGTIMRYQGGHYAKHMTSASTTYCSRVKRLMGTA